MKINFGKIDINLIDVNAGQLEGVPANPRKWSDAALKQLMKSIEETPEMLSARGVLVIPDGERFVAIGGNMRLEACRKLGYKEIPAVVVEGADPEKIKQFVIKDNGNFGEWDEKMLAEDWRELPLPDWGVELDTDWNAPSENTDVEEDDFEESSESQEHGCRKNEIFRLGEHILMCGDSSDTEAFSRLMGEDRADMVFTDPPYGVAIGNKNSMLNDKVPGHRYSKNIEGDTLSAGDLYPILVKAMTNCRTFCKSDSSYYVTSPQGGELGMMMLAMKDSGLPVRHMLIWKKDKATFSLGRLDYDYQHEPIFYTWTEKHHNYREGKFRTSIWEITKPSKCDLHPTMKPVELVANCLLDATKPGDIVLDAFGGSGTTLIAAEQLGRKARIMELDPHYCDVIISRWEKYTGKKAEKI